MANLIGVGDMTWKYLREAGSWCTDWIRLA